MDSYPLFNNQRKKNSDTLLLLASLCYLIVLLLLTGCSSHPEPGFSKPGFDPSTGIYTAEINGPSSLFRLTVLDSTGVVAAFTIPVKSGQLLSDSATLTGGSILLDVLHAHQVVESKNRNQDGLAYLNALHQTANPVTDSCLVLRINSTNPAPLLKIPADSGKLVNPTHLVAAQFDHGDTAHSITFGVKAGGFPKNMNVEAQLQTQPGVFNIPAAPKRVILLDAQFKSKPW